MGRRFLASVWVVLVAACGGGSTATTSPTPAPTAPTAPAATPIGSIVSGVQLVNGTAAKLQTGSLPTSNGGPTATLTAASAVNKGSAQIVTITADAPFASVLVGIVNTAAAVISSSAVSPLSGGRLENADGYYRIDLNAPVNRLQFIESYSPTLTANGFTVGYSVIGTNQFIGPIAQSGRTLNPTAAAGTVHVSLAWDTASNVDLHVVEPSGNEIYYGNPRSASGGALDVDSNGACRIDNKNNENIVWPSSAPNGNYTVRVDYWDDCNVKGTTTYSVVVNNGGRVSIFTGSFVSSDQDLGSRGSGRTITIFSHTGG